MAVSLNGKCAVTLGSYPAFLIIDNAVFENLLYFSFCNLPAGHPAFCMFGKNQMAYIFKRLPMAFGRTESIKSFNNQDENQDNKQNISKSIAFGFFH